MIWSWYLANDTQFYVVGIIILIIAARYVLISRREKSCKLLLVTPRNAFTRATFCRYIPLAMFLTIFLLIGSWITTATITLKTQHVPR